MGREGKRGAAKGAQEKEGRAGEGGGSQPDRGKEGRMRWLESGGQMDRQEGED